jgi:Na+/H+ antiporter NhaD/arsenite permease-like protein
MSQKLVKWSLLGMSVALALLAAGPASASGGGQDMATVIVSGKVCDVHQEPVSDCEIVVLVDGRPVEEQGGGHGGRHGGGWRTSSDGSFVVSFQLPKDRAPQADVALVLDKPSYKRLNSVRVPGLFQHPGDEADLFGHVQATLERHMGPAFWLALAILLGIYALIAFEVFHRTLAALLGAGLVLFVTYTVGTFFPDYFIISYEDAIAAIDWNVVFLLFGMMIIVGILKETGLFQWLAFKSFQLARGKVYLLSIILMAVTAVASAFLDNVTTMLLLTPVTIEICLILKLHPFALLLPEVLASNFGGTATLIGDPPNIMIGSYAGLTFNDFVIALTPVVILAMVAQIVAAKFYYGRDYKQAQIKETELQQMYLDMKVKYAITDAKLLKFGLGVLAFVIGLFIAHGALHMEVSIAALIGAGILLVLSRMEIVHLLEKDVEWPTLVFFMMLFIIVGAAEQVGLLQLIADGIVKVSAGNLVIAILIIAWVAAFMSALIDNIPFTATMLPIVAFLTRTIPGAEDMVLWWALALGACFGGNGTLIGASANVVTAGLMEKAGYPVSFGYFLKVGFPVMVVSMIISSAWLVFVMR